jgi:hypothetical protein
MSGHHHFQLRELARLSARLDELFAFCDRDAMSPDVADEVAATAGEIMLLLAGHGGDEMVRGALDDARRLREAARTLRPERARLAEAGAALTRDVERIIREEKRAA